MATGTDDSRTCAVAECDKGPILQTDGRVDARAFAVPRNERSGLITLVFLTDCIFYKSFYFMIFNGKSISYGKKNLHQNLGFQMKLLFFYDL